MSGDIRPAVLAELDQHWAEAKHWFAESDKQVVTLLLDVASDPDPSRLIAWMQKDPAVADIVGRLAHVALQQCWMNVMDDDTRVAGK